MRWVFKHLEKVVVEIKDLRWFEKWFQRIGTATSNLLFPKMVLALTFAMSIVFDDLSLFLSSNEDTVDNFDERSEGLFLLRHLCTCSIILY